MIGSTGLVISFKGKRVGTYRVTHKWRINGHVSDIMLQVAAVVGGKKYTGRSMGDGMALTGKLVAK